MDAERRLLRRASIALAGVALAGALGSAAAAAACFAGDDGDEVAAPVVTTTPTATAPTLTPTATAPAAETATMEPAQTARPTAVPASETERVALAFVDAWFRGDADAAREVATAEAVGALFAVDPRGQAPAFDQCFNVGTDQFDCNFETARGFLIVRVVLVDGAWLVEGSAFT
jgi:hypothetical protein